MIRVILRACLTATVIYAVLVSARAVFGQQSHKFHPWFAVVYVSDGSRGSGVLIGPDLVLTADHVIRDGGRPSCSFPYSGLTYRYRAAVRQRDSVNDIALLQLDRDLKIEPLVVSPRTPKPGENVWTYGKPGNSRTRWNNGKITAKQFYVSDRVPLMSWDSRARGGESGGPVFHDWGLLSIVSAARQYSYGVHPTALRARLTQWCPSVGGIRRCQPHSSRGTRSIYAGPPVPMPDRAKKPPPDQVPQPPTSPKPQPVDREADIEKLAEKLAALLLKRLDPPESQPQSEEPTEAQPLDPALVLDESQLARLVEVIAGDPRFKPPSGPAGQTGAPGPPGPPGIEPAQIAEIESRLEAIESATIDVNIRYPDGTSRSGKISLIGGKLTLDFGG